MTSQPLRSGLTASGIAVGIALVVLLTAIGSGMHEYILSEFTQFGTNLLGITPGKTTTAGISGALVNTVRPLSLEDADALRHVRDVLGVVPVVQGNAAVEYRSRSRRTYIFGVGSEVPAVWRMNVALGRFLPEDSEVAPRPYAVLGSKVRRELFGANNPLGRRIRIGGERYQVMGVMESKGQLLGFDLDDGVYIPAARALAMFNRESLMEIDVLFEPGVESEVVVQRIKELLTARHGTEDYTIITQEQMLESLGSVLNILTLAVGGLGGISLLVGGVGILTIMTIAVQERTAEIGLLRALGAHQAQIMILFLGEAVILSLAGGLAGLGVGLGGAASLNLLVPAIPVQISWLYIGLAEALALGLGLVAGVLPALHAAQMDPVESLRAE